jgi:O-acetyl-ADP-ribose deacetylase (regulator of RNase III)
MEIMRTLGGRTVVVDGAHTPSSVSRVAQSFLEVFPTGGVLLFGSVSGKRTEEMAEILAPLFRSIVISKPNPFKESDPREVFEVFRRRMISEVRRLLVPVNAPSYLAGRLTVVTGDITGMSVDAIVNAANSTLAGGGGVDGAIHRAGGPEILEQCQAIRRARYPDGLPAGQAVVTGGGRLSARWVIHTVGPVYRGGNAGEAETLRSAYRESLARASEIGARAIAFPAISTGVYGYPKDEAARIAYAAVAEHLAANKLPERVILAFYAQADAETFLRAALPA